MKTRQAKPNHDLIIDWDFEALRTRAATAHRNSTSDLVELLARQAVCREITNQEYADRVAALHKALKVRHNR